MNGRVLSAILLLLVLSIACFIAAPVFSGEHPWDSDRGDDNWDSDDGEGGRDGFYDTIVVIPDTAAESGTTGGGSSSSSIWSGLFAGVVSSLLMTP